MDSLNCPTISACEYSTTCSFIRSIFVSIFYPLFHLRFSQLFHFFHPVHLLHCKSCTTTKCGITIKGGSRRAEKSRKVLMMMKAAKLGWAGSGAGQELTMSRPGTGWEHARSRPGAMQEQGKSKSRAGALAVHIPNFIQIVLKT